MENKKIDLFNVAKTAVEKILEKKGILEDKGHWCEGKIWYEDDDIFADFVADIIYDDYDFSDLQMLFLYNYMLQVRACSLEEDVDFIVSFQKNKSKSLAD